MDGARVLTVQIVLSVSEQLDVTLFGERGRERHGVVMDLLTV